METFVHLHVHSHYSLLDGGSQIEALVDKAKELGMDSLALTDHGNMFGAIEFYKTCRDAGIKPVLGLEAYISPTHRSDRNFSRQSEACFHLILLAMNEAGFANLRRLSSRAYMEGFYWRPRIDRELLHEFNEGLICATACLGGEVPSALLAGNGKHARKVAEEYLDIFGRERFFIEIQNHGLTEQTGVNPLLADLAADMNVGLVATNDVHFLTREHKPSHEVLCAISTGKTIAESQLGEVYTAEMYLKSPAEMRQALARWPQAADNTVRIAQMCDLKLDFSHKHLPAFHTPAGQSASEYLRKLAMEGLERRFGAQPERKYIERLQWELKVICDKGYSSYFLIVNDFVQFARSQGIPSAPRGSGVATLLGYVLGIADVDPLKYGLLFERFTDPQREEAPDIDIDICQEGRPKVIDYVRRKYGHVAQIITYGTLKARAAIRDVARVLDMPLAEVDRIAKKVPEGLKVTIDSALESEPELRDLCNSDARVKAVIDHARNLEGLARHAGVHAAGVVIASEPLEDIVPLCRQSNSEDMITQWDGPTCDAIGLMKMDFLGLRTLTIIQRARELVKQRTGMDIDPETLDLGDQKVFELFRQGHTAGIFQFESGGMRDLLAKMKPDRIGDLIAANAMYRPGPMELIPSYCARKAGAEPVPSVHALVDDILEETYGIMVYQEQVMQVLNRLGKLPLNRALTLIKAISKKKQAAIAAEQPNFLAGARENGISEKEANDLFELILKFAGYGFNKAHSTRYAIVAYQSAYFKVYYPKEFMAATLTFEAGDTEQLAQYLEECKAMGIRVGPPDINASQADFTVVGEEIRFGLKAVKGVGGKAVEAILAGRLEAVKFDDLYHFCENVDLHAVNRSTIEALVRCGAFDRLGASRPAMLAALEKATELGQSRAADRRSGQMNFFDALGGGNSATPERPSFPDVTPWTEAQLLAAEKETLGFYVTSHPLLSYAYELSNLSSCKLSDLARLSEGAAITVGVMISQVRPTVVKQGKSAGRKMAMLTVEDLTEPCDCVIFSDAYDQYAELLTPESMVYLCGTVDRRREKPSIIVNEVIPIDRAIEKLTGQVELRLDGLAEEPTRLAELQKALEAHRGHTPVQLSVRPASVPQVVADVVTDSKWFVQPNRTLMRSLAELLREERVIFRGKKPAAPARSAWAKRNGNGANAARGHAGPASEAVTRFN